MIIKLIVIKNGFKLEVNLMDKKKNKLNINIEINHLIYNLLEKDQGNKKCNLNNIKKNMILFFKVKELSIKINIIFCKKNKKKNCLKNKNYQK